MCVCGASLRKQLQKGSGKRGREERNQDRDGERERERGREENGARSTSAHRKLDSSTDTACERQRRRFDTRAGQDRAGQGIETEADWVE